MPEASGIAAPKPLLRGVSHLFACILALVAGAVLVTHASNPLARLAGGIYSASLVAMFGASALYHRSNLGPRIQDWLQRLDHSTIFLFIAGSYTPFCLLALDPHVGRPLLIAAWTFAGLGVLQAMLWVKAPRFVSAAIYLTMGWMVLPFAGRLAGALGPLGMSLLVAGGVCFTAGAITYARRRPDPVPAVFGYHEVFHALVIAGCACQFAAVSIVFDSSH